MKYLDAINKILNPFAREIEPSVGDHGYCIGRVEEKGIDTKNRRVTATLSTPSIDRYGEIVLPSAFTNSLPRFRSNPKFLAGHQSWTMDGSPTSIGKWVDVQVTDKGLVGTAQFLPPGDELTDKWWFRFEHGAQSTFSVGFIAHKAEMREVEIDGAKKKIRHFTEAELLEVSAVELPANSDAMLMSLGLGKKSGGADRIDELLSLIKAMEQRHEASFKQFMDLMADPLGPIPILINNALDEREAGKGHCHHGEGNSNSGAAPHGSSLDSKALAEIGNVLEEFKRRMA